MLLSILQRRSDQVHRVFRSLDFTRVFAASCLNVREQPNSEGCFVGRRCKPLNLRLGELCASWKNSG
jgi:hypothetical protein